jgi:hypothetical protein
MAIQGSGQLTAGILGSCSFWHSGVLGALNLKSPPGIVTNALFWADGVRHLLTNVCFPPSLMRRFRQQAFNLVA